MTESDGIGRRSNDLIQTCIDGQKGFEAAAKAIDDPSIKDELVGYSWQRQQFATDLRSHGFQVIHRRAPETHGSTSGALHRGWMNVKSALGGNDKHAILAECERGEDAAEEAYRKAMGTSCREEYNDLVSEAVSDDATHARPHQGASRCDGKKN